MKKRTLSISVILALLIQIFGCLNVYADSSGAVVKENNYLPKRAITQVFNAGLLLSWQNPVSATLTDVKIYNITDGAEVLLCDSVSAEADKIVMYEATGLTAGMTYQFRVDFSFSDRDDVKYYFMGKAATVNEPKGTENRNITVSVDAQRVGTWTVDVKNQSYKAATKKYDRRQPLKYTLDAEEKHGSEGASFRIDANAVDYDNATTFNNMFVHIQSATISLKANTAYKLTYWTKTEDIKGYTIHMSWAKFSEDKLNTAGPVKGDTEWTQHELVHITGSSNENKQIMVIFKNNGTIWFDDFEMYEAEEVVENGVKSYVKKADAENIVKDGSFDTVSKNTANVEGLKFKDDFGGVKFTWDSISNCSGFNIYEPIGDTYEFRGRIPANGNSTKLAFESGEYSYALAPVNMYGIEGEMSGVFTAKSMVDVSKYNIKSAFTSPFSEGLLLTWKNPTSTALKDVKVYNITGGTEELVEGTISTENSKYVLFPVEGLTNGDLYQFKAVFDFGSEGKRTYYFTGRPTDIRESTGTSSNAVTFGSWNSEFYNQSKKVSSEGEVTTPFEKKQPFHNVLDESAGYGDTGNAMRFDGNADGTEFNSIYVKFQSQMLTMKANTAYKLTYRTKTDNLKGYMIHLSFTPFSEDKLNTNGPVKGTTEWTQHELVHVTGNSNESKQLTIVFKYIGTLWVDDFEMYEAEAVTEGDVTTYVKKPDAVNLIKDGDFENIAVNDGVISNLKAFGGEKSVTLSWDKVTGGCENLNIYEEINGQYHSIGKVLAEAGSIKISDLTKGVHKFKLAPVNIQGIEGTASEVHAESVLPDYEIGTPEFNKTAGIIKVPVKNYKIDDGLNVEIFASFCVGNAMRKLYTGKAVVLKSDEKSSAQNVEVTFELDSADTKLELYVFDSRNNMNILYPSVIYQITEQ